MTITLYFLQSSRAIRCAWLLEELGLDYEVKFAERELNKAPQWMKDEVGSIGKLPALKDGDLLISESGNILEYLCDTYDKEHRILPAAGDPKRYKVLEFLHLAETYMTHGLAVTYSRWSIGEEAAAPVEKMVSANVHNDLNYITTQLEKNGGKFILKDLTLADIAVEFSLDFIMTRKLGTLDKKWPRLEQYLKDTHETKTWAAAAKKTGYKL